MSAPPKSSPRPSLPLRRKSPLSRNVNERLRDWALYRLRSWAWDISKEVQWLDQDQPYYEREDIVDAYDSVAWAKGDVDNLSTMRSPTSGALIELMRERGCRSVLDIGCGAGAFYHLLSKTVPGVRYHGIDASNAQIKRDRKGRRRFILA